MTGPVRLAYLVSHPIQYQVPLFRLLAQDPAIELTVLFGADTTRGIFDRGFGREVQWDVPLLGGYRHKFLPNLGWGAITALRPPSLGVLRELRRERFDVLWIHGYTRLTNLIAVIGAKSLGLKVLVRDEAHATSTERGPAKRAARALLFVMLKRFCDAFLAIGTLNRRYYLSLGVPAEKIFLVPYAVDNDFFQSRAEAARAAREDLRRSMGLSENRPVILFAGKLSLRKAPIDLLEAYESLSRDGISEPEPYLLYAGDGELRGPLQARAAARGWRSVKFIGFKNQTELPALYDLCDVLVLPSVREPWGLVVNEAMNAGRAIVASDRVGCGPDLVQPGVNGYIFAAGDVAALGGALKRMLSDPASSRRMGEASREIIARWGLDRDILGLKHALQSIGLLGQASGPAC